MTVPDLSSLETWLAEREAAVGGVRAGCAKQIVWANGAVKTPISVVYVHGFSATGAEVRPLPDLVAKSLDANLYFARLTGHGQDGAAMGKARLPDWEADVEEALEIGSALGDEVIVMGCSTGCTLLTSALARGRNVRGVIHLSPNFGLTHKLAQMLLDMPMVRKWGPLVAGRERSFDPISQAHSDLWTVRYDTQAVFTMGDAVRAARSCKVEAITTPAYFAYNEADQVVCPKRTRAIMARWAGPIEVDKLVQGPCDDAMGHVMAGDVFSPAQTEPLAHRIVSWAKRL